MFVQSKGKARVFAFVMPICLPLFRALSVMLVFGQAHANHEREITSVYLEL